MPAGDQVERLAAGALVLDVVVADVVELTLREVAREVVARRHLLQVLVQRVEEAAADEGGNCEAEHHHRVERRGWRLHVLGQLLVQRPDRQRGHLHVDPELLLDVGNLVLDALVVALGGDEDADGLARERPAGGRGEQGHGLTLGDR